MDAERPMMSSKEIAELTSKQHKIILRDIRDMLNELEGEDGTNLYHKQYQLVTDDRGYTSECFLDKELSLLLVSGYNLKLRYAIICRWQELENQTAPKTELEVALQQSLATTAAIQGMIAAEKRLIQVEDDVTEVKEDIKDVKKTLAEEQDNQMVTVLGFCRLHNIPATDGQLSGWGRRLTTLAKRKGVTLGRTHHAKYGYANTYPKWLLTEFFAELGLV